MTDIPDIPIVQKSPSVLISGGSGLIGKHLTAALLEQGYNVSHLSRNTRQTHGVKVYKWDPGKKYIDPVAFEGIDYIVHLAGANIGEKRWTSRRKKEIIESRIGSAELLFKTLTERGIRLQGFISASATGIYGSENSSEIFFEKDPPAEDFLGSVCKLWEEAADLFSNSGIRTVKIRSAVVLEKNDSALSKIMKTANFGFLIKTGNGLQYMPWIHVTDLCNIYVKAIKDSEMSGAFNAVAPQHVTHNEFMNVLGSIMERPVFPVPVPAFVLRTVLGEMSEVILKGSRVSSEKIILSGYNFLFDTLEAALVDVIKE